MRFIVVEGEDESIALERASRLIRNAQSSHVATNACGPSDWLPTDVEQVASLTAYEKVVSSPEFEQLREEVGLPSTGSAPAPAERLTIGRLLEISALEPLKRLRFEQTARGAASIILLEGIKDEKALEALVSAMTGATYVNRARFISSMLDEYRGRATRLIVAAYALIAVLLLVRYGPRAGASCMIPPLAGMAATLIALHLTGGSLNIFTLFGILLTLGLGIDFGVFFLEGETNEPGTAPAIVVSALTSALSTGALAFCSTPMLSQFGIAVAVGILTSMITAPLAASMRRKVEVSLSPRL